MTQRCTKAFEAADFGRLTDAIWGRRVCIMGGAPSLADDLRGIEADVWISANEHGARLRPVDFVVCVDSVHGVTGKSLREHIRAFTDAPIISPESYADFRLRGWPNAPERLLSGVTAMYVAGICGAASIQLAGFSRQMGQDWQTRLVEPFIFCPVYGSPYEPENEDVQRC